MRIGIGFLAQAAGVALGFGFTLLITRVFPPPAVGSYYLTLTLANVGGVVAAAGLGPAALQLMGREEAAGRRRALGGLALAGALAGGAVVGSTAVLLEVSGLLAHLFPGLAPGSWRWAVVPAVAVSLVVREVFRAEGRGHVPLVVDQLLRNVLKIGVALLAATGVVAASAEVLYAALVGATVAGALLGAGLAGRHLALPSLEAAAGPDARRLLGIGAPLLANGVLWLALGWTDTLMVGGMRGTEAAAYYSVALKVATLAAMGLVAVSAVLPERFGRLWRRGDRAGAGRVLRESGYLAGALAVPVAVAFGLLAGEILAVFGPPYAAGGTALRILLAGQAVHALSGFAGIALNMVGGHRQVLAVNATAALLNVLLNVLLVPPFGIDGAAAASATSLVVMNLVQGGILVRAWGTRWFASGIPGLAGLGLLALLGAVGLAALPLGALATTAGAVVLSGSLATAAYLRWEAR